MSNSTSNPTELQPDTSITAVSYNDNGIHLRVYFQDIQGKIRESRYSLATDWTGGTSDDVVAEARPNSPLAAISFHVDMMGFGYYYGIRLFYISPDNILRERCIDTVKKTWFAGDLDALNIEASSVSRLAAITSNAWNSSDVSLFYQRPDGAIGNIYYNAPLPFPSDLPVGWSDRGIVGHMPLVGTGLAAAPFYTGDRETSYNRLFYQLPNGQLAATDIDWTGKFSDGDLPVINNASVATNISAWSPATKTNSIRLCFLDKQNTPIERVYSDGKWTPSKPAGQFLPVPASDISTIQTENADNLRLYVQDENNVIQEFVWAKGYEEWLKGSLVPVGIVQ